jgi:undecaprenyl-diphosphatase
MRGRTHVSENPVVADPAGVSVLPAMLRPVAHPVRSITLGCLGIVFVLVCGLLITSSAAWTHGELAILQQVSDHHAPAFDSLSIAIAWLFGTQVGPVLLVGWCVILTFLSKRVTVGATFLVIVGVTWMGNQGMKALVARPRPDRSLLSHPLTIEHSFSFPSGHTCFVAALAIALIVLFRGSRWQPLVVVIGAACAVIVGASRVYVGVHHPSDVIAALIYACAAAAVIVPLWNRYAVPRLLWLDRPLQRPGPAKSAP